MRAIVTVLSFTLGTHVQAQEGKQVRTRGNMSRHRDSDGVADQLPHFW